MNLDSISELTDRVHTAVGTPEVVDFCALRQVLLHLLGYLAYLTGEAYEAEGVHVPAGAKKKGSSRQKTTDSDKRLTDDKDQEPRKDKRARDEERASRKKEERDSEEKGTEREKEKREKGKVRDKSKDEEKDAEKERGEEKEKERSDEEKEERGSEREKEKKDKGEKESEKAGEREDKRGKETKAERKERLERERERKREERAAEKGKAKGRDREEREEEREEREREKEEGGEQEKERGGERRKEREGSGEKDKDKKSTSRRKSDPKEGEREEDRPQRRSDKESDREDAEDGEQGEEIATEDETPYPTTDTDAEEAVENVGEDQPEEGEKEKEDTGQEKDKRVGSEEKADRPDSDEKKKRAQKASRAGVAIDSRRKSIPTPKDPASNLQKRRERQSVVVRPTPATSRRTSVAESNAGSAAVSRRESGEEVVPGGSGLGSKGAGPRRGSHLAPSKEGKPAVSRPTTPEETSSPPTRKKTVTAPARRPSKTETKPKEKEYTDTDTDVTAPDEDEGEGRGTDTTFEPERTTDDDQEIRTTDTETDVQQADSEQEPGVRDKTRRDVKGDPGGGQGRAHDTETPQSGATSRAPSAPVSRKTSEHARTSKKSQDETGREPREDRQEAAKTEELETKASRLRKPTVKEKDSPRGSGGRKESKVVKPDDAGVRKESRPAKSFQRVDSAASGKGVEAADKKESRPAKTQREDSIVSGKVQGKKSAEKKEREEGDGKEARTTKQASKSQPTSRKHSQDNEPELSDHAMQRSRSGSDKDDAESARRRPSDDDLDEVDVDDEEASDDEEVLQVYDTPLYAKKTGDVRKQDLDDLLKRVEHMEHEMLKMKAQPKVLSMNSANLPPSFNSDVLFDMGMEHFRAQTKLMEKKVEMMQEEQNNRIAELKMLIESANSQLQYLPSAGELYKSYFPSWKMLEDVLGGQGTLRQNIKEVREMASATEGSTLGAKQLARFLGNPGPSERLLTTLEEIGKQTKMGQQWAIMIKALTDELAEVKKRVAVKQVSGSKKKGGIPPGALGIQGVGIEPDEDGDETPRGKRASQVFSNVDSGYLGFKLAKLGEEVFGIRKELDSIQLLKDKVEKFTLDVKVIQDSVIVMRRDFTLKDERDHAAITNIQMEMNEFQQELCGMESRKNVQLQKMEWENWRANLVRDSASSTQSGGRGVGPGHAIIDREARIRTQQLQMQMNTMHQILTECQNKFPDLQCPAQPHHMPEEMLHPWGTGREGAPSGMRSGVGTQASPVSPPPPRTMSMSPPLRVTGIPRPTPVGGVADSPGSQRGRQTDDDIMRDFGLIEYQRMDVDAYGIIPPRAIPMELTKKLEEEKAKLQQTITRLNTTNQVMAAKLEACLNQQTAESRRLQDLMSRMHKENLMRYNELQTQLEEFFNEEYDLLNEASPNTALVEGGILTASPPLVPTTSPTPEVGGSPPGSRAASASKRRSATRSALMTLRKEMMGHIKALRKRIANVENLMPEMQDVETEAAAAFKRPVWQTFQCLSCDKRVDLSKLPRGDGPGTMVSVVAPCMLPELPRIAPICSPPRMRLTTKSGPRVTALDQYQIPRQCGGSYTSTNKPRRIYYFSNLGEAMEKTINVPTVERVDMKGTDGHIYKGHLQQQKDWNQSMALLLASPPPPRNRADDMPY